MSKGKKVSSENKSEVKVKESFFERYKSDKKFNAMVQLGGYGVFILGLIIYLNVTGMHGGSTTGNNIIGNTVGSGILDGENASLDDSSLLEKLSNNYNYDIKIDYKKISMDTTNNKEVEIEHSIRYSGKSYDNKLEINKVKDNNTYLYYKVDNKYYSMIDNITSNVKDNEVYDVISNEYIEIDKLLELINESSLDHVTNFSSGKKEYVYHYKVLSSNSSNNIDNIVEIEIEEDNGILNIDVDYTNLVNELDNTIVELGLDAIVSDIGLVEDFEVIVSDDENTSIE